MDKNMFDSKNRFIIKNYMKQSTFSSFLPGISGERGIPIWCFYVNRGQAIASFGIQDKDHSIMEFYPAHQSYQLASTLGFRTFLRLANNVYEPFQNPDIEHTMYIGTNELEIEEKNTQVGLKTNVLYYTLPEEKVGGLVRVLSITNLDNMEKKLEVLDGMPALLPYGVNLEQIKNIGQTVKAWMQSEDSKEGVPYFRARFSIKDTAVVKPIEGGNFYYSVDEYGNQLPVIVDPRVVFDYDTSMIHPYGFRRNSLQLLMEQEQSFTNQEPCCFTAKKIVVKPGETVFIYNLIGQCESKDILHHFIGEQKLNQEYFIRKRNAAIRLTREIGDLIDTKSGDPLFDAYCRQSYIDNVLRGGFPIRLGDDKVFYIYSRKHGDIERDYNYFCMQPEFYSQGNGNYRDVNQNRRCDPLFTPYVRDENIKIFYNLIQLDGYNPLIIQRKTYRLMKEKKQELAGLMDENGLKLIEWLENSTFTPGELLEYIHKNNVAIKESEELFLDKVISLSVSMNNVSFGEGYWTDHWVYNLDLVESYLTVYPEDKNRLLFEDASYSYYEPKVVVLERSKRYQLTENGIRQHRFLDEECKSEVTHELIHTEFGKGEVFYSTLMSKLFILALNKFTTLDPYGLGIEMEGGRPGWYDALNGFPAIFGSSMTESYELLRMVRFMKKSVKETNRSISIPIEVGEFYKKVKDGLEKYEGSHDKSFELWKVFNEAKEEYRKKTIFGIEGAQLELTSIELLEGLEAWTNYLDEAVIKAKEYSNNPCPTYFYYEMDEYHEEGDSIIPLHFTLKNMPMFLEGGVKSLKLQENLSEKKKLYEYIKQSALFDKKLSMYKVNESLAEMGYELGRAKAFTPGWLENESIWLHMEYKYLLELIKNDLYEEFITDFKTACVPFLDPQVYGRSILENSSFIASSSNPDKQLHGKGFVARLSGSTVEMIHIWQIMMFGKTPFSYSDNRLILEFRPLLPEYLIGEDRQVMATFLGKTKVEYHMSNRTDLIPGNYNISEYQLYYKDSKDVMLLQSISIQGEVAEDIRNGLVERIVVIIKN